MTQQTCHSNHLLGLEGLDQTELLSILDAAGEFTGVVHGETQTQPLLTGRVIATMFFENSTRTRMSFATAVCRLGGNVIDLNAATSSATKGETLLDTALNIQAMGVDAMVIRCSASGGPHLVAEAIQTPVINAGDGSHEHPTQGLLDALALQRHLECRMMDGLTIAIVGDIASSRVARSNAHGLTTLGANVIFVGPPALVPDTLEQIVTNTAPGTGTVRVTHDLDEALAQVDAVMMLRVQFERHGGAGIDDDYAARYGLTVARAARLAEGVPVLHPGPINRGLEIDPEVADGDRSLILDQVTCGVAVRMAVLDRVLNR